MSISHQLMELINHFIAEIFYIYNSVIFNNKVIKNFLNKKAGPTLTSKFQILLIKFSKHWIQNESDNKWKKTELYIGEEYRQITLYSPDGQKLLQRKKPDSWGIVTKLIQWGPDHQSPSGAEGSRKAQDIYRNLSNNHRTHSSSGSSRKTA